jgi:hypothetical protein
LETRLLERLSLLVIVDGFGLDEIIKGFAWVLGDECVDSLGCIL